MKRGRDRGNFNEVPYSRIVFWVQASMDYHPQLVMGQVRLLSPGIRVLLKTKYKSFFESRLQPITIPNYCGLPFQILNLTTKDPTILWDKEEEICIHKKVYLRNLNERFLEDMTTFYKMNFGGLQFLEVINRFSSTRWKFSAIFEVSPKLELVPRRFVRYAVMMCSLYDFAKQVVPLKSH